MLIEIWCSADRKFDYNAAHLGYGKPPLANACFELAAKRKSFNKRFDPKTMTFAGCKLFDNETEAKEFNKAVLV
jgi:hypothetical protein